MSAQGIAVTQSKYIKDLGANAGLFQAKTATTPLPIGIKFTTDAGSERPNPKQKAHWEVEVLGIFQA
ncbi:UNVERIFIED_CONTAM: hypothetical protein Sradi_1549700 [Sesamum radiatum]|uniref:Uncharacterized protein n=1 Tax=Sesamum radiatum TaxID=300843 RepID=A0AAW2U9A7_SESRA